MTDHRALALAPTPSRRMTMEIEQVDRDAALVERVALAIQQSAMDGNENASNFYDAERLALAAIAAIRSEPADEFITVPRSDEL